MSENLARVIPLTEHSSEMTQLILAFSTLRRQNARAIASLSAAHGISSTDLRALSFVSLTESPTPKMAAEHLGLTTGSLTALVDRLAVAGFIERAAFPGDRRSVLLRLTAQGSALMLTVNDLYQRAFAQALDDADIVWMRDAFLGLAEALGSLAD